MLKSGGGSIVNIASTVSTMAINDRLAYSTSKGGVLAMTYAVAKDHLHDKIRCNAIQPGRIHTPFVDGFIAKNYPDNQEKMFRKLSEYQPVGRMGKPEEVAAMAVFLCSDEASFITGSPFAVDGGTLYVRYRLAKRGLSHVKDGLDDAGLRFEPVLEFAHELIVTCAVRQPRRCIDHPILNQLDDARKIAWHSIA